MAISFVSKITDSFKEANKIIAHMKEFIEPLKKESRKDAAQKILGSYGGSIRAGLAFSLLDGKTLSDKELKKVMQQILE